MRLSNSVNPQVNGSELSFDAIFGNLVCHLADITLAGGSLGFPCPRPIGAGIRAWAQTTRHRTEVPIAQINKYWVKSPVSTVCRKIGLLAARDDHRAC